MKHSIKDWILATRPWSFPASIMPILIGIGYVYSIQGSYPDVNWLNGILALVGMVLFHAAGNLISDYYDFKNGIDSAETHGDSSLVSGTFEPITIFRFGLTTLIIGSLIGLYITYSAGLGVLWIGLCGAIIASFYYLFKTTALGDLVVLLAFGILPTLGAGYALTSEFITQMIYLGIVIGLPTVAILHSNNTRDIRSDGYAKIITFAIILGVKGSKIFYFLLLTVPFAMITVMCLYGVLPIVSLMVFLSLPLVVKNIRQMNSIEEDLDVIVGLDIKTAQLQMVFGLLLTVSLCIGHFMQ